MHENKTLRSKIHGEHHLAVEPLPMDYIYAHPIEVLLGMFGMIIPLFFKSIYVYSFVFTAVLRNIHEIELHTNNNKSSIIPFFNSPYKHYIHHSKAKNCNYASMLPIWDYLMGTEYKVK